MKNHATILKQVLIICFIVFTKHFTYAQTIEEQPFYYSPELLSAADDGDADAMYKIGICYYVGKAGAPTLIKNEVPLEKDQKLAFKYLSKAADKGSALAMVNLGNIYKIGIGAPDGKDIKKALKWYEKAAENGCADAYANIGQIYQTEIVELVKEKIIKINLEDPENHLYTCLDKAMEYNKIAAEKGSKIGAYNLGIAYSSYLGYGIAIDYQQAIDWFYRAAELGYGRAVNDLAVRYMTGTGVIQNKRRGIELLKMAALDEEPMALHNIGVYYYNGISLPKDKEKAVYFFFKASQLGHKNAAALTECYNAGLQGAKYFSTEQAWLDGLKAKFDTIATPEIIIPQARKVYSVELGDVIDDCGSWSVTDTNGICITEHRYDSISFIPETNKLKAYLYGYSTFLDEDGSEQDPILEQMLGKIAGDNTSQNVQVYSLQLLGADHDNTLNYKDIAYYNLAVYLRNNNLNKYAEIYLEKCLEINPDFNAAKEDLALLQEEAKAKKDEIKSQRRKLIWDCITTGIAGTANILGQVASMNQAKESAANIDKESNRQRNKEIAKANKQKAKEARREMVGSINRRATSRAYSEYVGQINDMKLYPDKYDEQQKKQIQSEMKRLRSEYDLPYHESEDW